MKKKHQINSSNKNINLLASANISDLRHREEILSSSLFAFISFVFCYSPFSLPLSVPIFRIVLISLLPSPSSHVFFSYSSFLPAFIVFIHSLSFQVILYFVSFAFSLILSHALLRVQVTKDEEICQEKTKQSTWSEINICQIRGSRRWDYENCYFLGYDSI